MTTKASERRTAPRVHSALPFEIYDSKGRVVMGEGKFLNLSTIGGLVASPKALKPKSTVRLHIPPSGKAALEILGRVIWTRKKPSGYMHGIRFSPRQPS